MTTREKNLLIFFLELTSTDDGCTKKWDEVTHKLSKLAYKLGIKDGTPENRDFMELEKDITDLFQMTKERYFNFGEKANEVIEEYDLDWTPLVAKKLEEEYGQMKKSA